MSTHSTIAIVHNDGTVQSIYAHSDGYISYNGVMLYQHYQDPDKVKQLIELGSLSILHPEVNPPHGVKHSYDQRHPGVTVFYGRDRNETGQEPNTYPSLQEYLKSGNFESYDYIFKEKNNNWYRIEECYQLNIEQPSSDLKKTKLKKLETILKNDITVSEEVKEFIVRKKMAQKLDRVLDNKTPSKKNKL